MGALFVFFAHSYGQADSITFKANTSQKNADSIKVKEYKLYNTRVATLSSAILPGLGQAYNGKYWKIPIIYGVGGVLYYFYDYNHFYYQRLKTEYNRPQGQPITDPEIVGMTSEEIRNNMDYFRRNQTRMIIFLGLLYTANIVDAMVDSYMREYDVSKDLTLKVSPTLMEPAPNAYALTYGLKVGLRF